eukprot:scaffold23127_cov202-Skeletonema_marinoi.AAC.1
MRGIARRSQHNAPGSHAPLSILQHCSSPTAIGLLFLLIIYAAASAAMNHHLFVEERARY